MSEKSISSMGFYEARTRLSELLDDVERGRTILITRHGKAVALLSPPTDAAEPSGEEAVSELLAFRKSRKRTLGTLTARALIEAGRKR
jgi:antitoxin (DNA-binding transcriptional repressor) of toxin-antitoxin stability system